MTWWRRLRNWQAAGVWDKLHWRCWLGCANTIRLTGVAPGSTRQRGQPPGSGNWPKANGRGKLGSKRHIVVDASGVPLAITVLGANRHDSTAFESTEAIPAVLGLDRRPRKRPRTLHADNGQEYTRCRRYLRKRGITARIARKGIESKDRLGRHRRAVGRTHSRFAGFGKLRIRFERRLDSQKALLSIAAAVITSRLVDDLC
ncbi:IS5 family transposase [Pseudoduganella lutea]